jgi:hypothetical protein
MADAKYPTFSSLHRNISHLHEVATYLSASLSRLEAKLRGFSGISGELPTGIKESICRDLHHQAGVSGFLFESLEDITACLCREHPEPDIVGHDLAEQVDHNDRGQP